MTDFQSPLFVEMQIEIDRTIREIIARQLFDFPDNYRIMVEYQMGLDNQPGSNQSQGKRLRPLFVLLSCNLFGVDWHNALPAAAAVELLHNFSLVHDDIQDESETRRGRETVWKKWGIAQAINIGDALLNLAYLSIHDLNNSLEDSTIDFLQHSLQKTCLLLTKGQHLDIAFEKERQIPTNLYWQMIEGKTAALISTSFEIGSIVAGASTDDQRLIAEFGRSIGLAFQVQDDYLGIWGNDKQTGKSIYSDLMSRKKTYPIIRGLEKQLNFSTKWNEAKLIDYTLAREMSIFLESEGVKDDVASKHKELFRKAWDSFNRLSVDQKNAVKIRNLIKIIENRTM